VKPLCAFAVGVAALGLMAIAGSHAILIPQKDIDAENAHYASLGLTLPKGGIVLDDPFDPPYSGRSFIVPRSWLNEGSPDPNPTVVASALRADLPVLRLVMERTYSGWESAAARGFDWDAWFQSWDRELASNRDQSISLRSALAPWNKLEDFQPDNHTHPMLLGFSGGSLSAILANAPPGLCTALTTADGRELPRSTADAAQQPHAVQSWDGWQLSAAWYVSFPDRYGTITSITCGGHSIGATMTSQPILDAVKPFYKDLGDGIAYIRTPFAFNYASNEAFHRLLAGVPGLGKSRAVLLDLRGNGGGAAPRDILAAWFTPVQVSNVEYHPGNHIGSASPCIAWALQFNLGQLFMFEGLKAPLPDDVRANLQRVLDGLGGDDRNTCDSKPALTRITRAAPLDHHFSVTADPQQTRVIAVVDNECGSDCEAMVSFIEQLPDTVIAGTSTAGTIGFTQPGMLVLPHSRLNVMLATARDDVYGDGRSEASYGLAVDVLLPTPQSQELQSLTALAHALLARPR
jgi:hypothetical protein